MNKKLLRKKLALMLANLKKKRKYYCEVEYLESTNQQSDYTSTNAAAYIDTGIIPNNNTRIECRMQFTTLISGQSKEALNGTTGAESAPRFAWGFASLSPYTNFYFGLGAQNLTTSVTRDTNVHTFVLDAKNKTCSIDDTTQSFTSSGSVDSTRSIYLFARHAGVEYANKPCNAKIYCCKIYDNETIVRDFIPVLDWDMTPCMFDRVTEQLFYNQGTGSFVAGRQIHPVDYLESTGTQYIDTRIEGKDGITAETRIQRTTTSSNECFVGAYNTVNRLWLVYTFGGQWYRGYNTTAGGWTPSTPITDWYTVKSSIPSTGTVVFDCNGTSISSIYTTGFNTGVNVQLFQMGNTGTNHYPAKGKMSYCKLYDNNTLVRDFIPAISEDGTAFMFDRVSHTCFLNQGTGAFKYSAREVEYLESDGARAIVAGITVDDTCGYDVKWMALNADDRIILGTKGSGDSRWALSGNNNPNINLSWNTIYISNGLGLNKIQTAQMNYLNNRKRILNDTPLEDITTPLASEASRYNVGIFAGCWGASTISLYSTCRIYYAKISKGTELIRDFIPMIKDGSPCLYDKVGGEYYYGIGTGSFTTGRIVEPEYE